MGCAQKLGDEPAGGRADYPDTNRPGHLAGEGDDVGKHRLKLGLDSPRPGHDDLAGLGELPVRAVYELAAELTLEFFHVRRDVRLNRLQRVGGGREGAMVRNSDDRARIGAVPSQRTIAAIDKSCLTDAVNSCTMYLDLSSGIPPPATDES